MPLHQRFLLPYFLQHFLLYNTIWSRYTCQKANPFKTGPLLNGRDKTMSFEIMCGSRTLISYRLFLYSGRSRTGRKELVRGVVGNSACHSCYMFSCKYCFVKTGAGSTKNWDSVRTKQQLVCVVHIKVGWTWLLGVVVVVVLMCSYPKWDCLQESVHYRFTMFLYTFCKYCLSVWLNKWVIIELQLLVSKLHLHNLNVD